MDIPATAPLRAQIVAEIRAQHEAERVQEERIRAEVREEIRNQMDAEHLALIEDLREREIELEKRIQAVKEKEDDWVKTYGPGIVQGGSAGEL